MFTRRSFFSRIPRYVAVLITIGLLIITGVVMYFYTKYQEKWLMALVVVLTLAFVLSMNAMVARFAVFKPKARKFPKEYYEIQTFSEIESRLVKAGFKKTNRQFGEGFIKIEGTVAYKILLVEKSELYFDKDDSGSQEPTKGINRCTKLVGFEIFFENSADVLKRIPDFSFKGDKVLYEGFYVDKEKGYIIEANKIDVEPHIEEYNRLIEILGFTKKEYVEEETKGKKNGK